MSTVESYPVQVEIDYPERLSRLLIFVKWLVAIPHFIILVLYLIPLWFAAIISWFTILFSGKMPPALFDFILGFSRWALRVLAYLFLLRDEYPPFTNQDADYPARVHCEYPESLSRGLIFVKWLLVIPHLIILALYGIVVVIVLIISWFAILFTGRYPRAMFDFVAGFLRWNTRVILYSGIFIIFIFIEYNPYVGGLLRDEYPPFSNR